MKQNKGSVTLKYYTFVVKKILYLWIGSVLVMASHFVLADVNEEIVKQLSLADLLQLNVYAPARRLGEYDTAPSNITVITRQQILERGHRDLKDVLRTVAGYAVIPDLDEWVFAARGNVGDNNSQYLLLLDGHRLNSTENFGAGYNIELPNDLSDVQQIEIIRGPGSVLWGSGALSGVINIVTQRAEDIEPSVTLKVGQDDTAVANFQLGEDFETLSGVSGYLTLTGVLATVGGTTVTQPDAFGFNISGYNQTQLDHVDLGHKFHLKAGYGDFAVAAYFFNTAIENRIYEVGAGRTNFIDANYQFIEGSWSHQFTNGLNLISKISVDNHEVEWVPDEYNPVATPPVNAHLIFQDDAMNIATQLNQSLRDNKLILDAGFEYSHTKYGPNTFDALFDPMSGGSSAAILLDKITDDDNFYFFNVWTYKLRSTVQVLLGASADYNSRRAESTELSPRAGVIWTQSERRTLKLLYNEAFLRPSNYQDSSRVKPETMQQLDAIWVQRGSQFVITTTLYWQELSGFVNFISEGSFGGFDNAGTYTSNGVETELSAMLGPHSIWANISFADAEGKDFKAQLAPDNRRVLPDGDLLSYPGLMANAGATLRYLNNRFTIAPTFRYQGEVDIRTEAATDPSLNLTAEYSTVGDFVYFDLNFQYHLTQNVTASLLLYNLLDETDSMQVTVFNTTMEQYGRYIQASFRYEF